MEGAASILFWCAAVRRPKSWSARSPGALVWACLSAANPAGAGGCGRWGAWCAGPAPQVQPPRVTVPSRGGGAPPRLRGGGGSLLWLPRLGGERGGGVGGPPPRPPAPLGVGLPSVVFGVPPQGILVPWGLPGGCGRRARSGWPPTSQCSGGGGGTPPPWFAPPSSPGQPLKGPLRLRRHGPRRSAVGRQRAGGAGACLSRGAPAPRVQRPLRGGCGAAVPSVCLRPLLGLRGRGGGEWAGPSGPQAPPPDGRGGGGMAVPASGASHRLGGCTPPPPPST